jgi:hypothetical protein
MSDGVVEPKRGADFVDGLFDRLEYERDREEEDDGIARFTINIDGCDAVSLKNIAAFLGVSRNELIARVLKEVAIRGLDRYAEVAEETCEELLSLGLVKQVK